jgi:hypothetical protein
MKATRLLMVIITILINLDCMKIEAQGQPDDKVAKARKSSLNQITHFGSFETIQGIEETTLQKVVAEENVIAIGRWDLIKKEYLCIVTLQKSQTSGYSIPNFQLSFYEKVKDKLVKKYVYETMASFLSLYPIGEVGNLVTIWVAGSGYQFVIFSASDDKIKIVFDDGSKSIPEIVDIDNDGQYELLVTKGDLLINSKTKEVIALPEGRDVYKWDGNTYVKIGFIPWGNKIVPLQKGR